MVMQCGYLIEGLGVSGAEKKKSERSVQACKIFCPGKLKANKVLIHVGLEGCFCYFLQHLNSKDFLHRWINPPGLIVTNLQLKHFSLSLVIL